MNKDNIFEELGFDRLEAANLKIRAELILQLREHIRKHDLKQKEAADRLGITQPDVSSIENCKIDRFTIDKLVTLLARAGYDVKITSNSKRRTFSIIQGGKDDNVKTISHPDDCDLLEA